MKQVEVELEQNWAASWSLSSRAVGCGSCFGTAVDWWKWIWARRSSLKTLSAWIVGLFVVVVSWN